MSDEPATRDFPLGAGPITVRLMAFLRARLEEEEQKARKAAVRAATWTVGATWHLEGVEYQVIGEEEAFCHPHNADHIASHHPARVQRHVEAMRRRVTACENVFEEWAWCKENRTIDDPVRVLMLQRADWAGWELRDLASIWSDHPNYKAEWQPRP